MRTLAVCLAFTAVAAVSCAAAIWEGQHIIPRTYTVNRTVQACPGIHGVEKCVREQISAQGAPSGELTCYHATGATYLCEFAADGGAGCWNIVANRGRDGYALLGTVAQESSCT